MIDPEEFVTLNCPASRGRLPVLLALAFAAVLLVTGTVLWAGSRIQLAVQQADHDQSLHSGKASIGPSGLVTAAANRSAFTSIAKTPLSFEANQGQSDGRVKFLSRGRGYQLFLTNDEAVLKLQRRGSGQSVIRMKLAGANLAAHVNATE
jgi:hypothetical protein